MPTVRPLDAAHEAVLAMRGALPLGARLAGGSFSVWLPALGSLTVEERGAVRTRVQEEARAQCVRDLLSEMEVPPPFEVPRGLGGDPMWPEGWVGSITNKRTVVLAATLPRSAARSVGIDLEFDDGAQLDPSYVAPEGLATCWTPPLATLIAFSAKESVFKAQYPLTGQILNFSEVSLDWIGPGPHARALARCPIGAGLGNFVVSVRLAGKWVATVAIHDDPQP